MTWGTSTNPAGTFAKEKDVPSQEVRKFCRQNNLAFVTENCGFYGTSIYARDIGREDVFQVEVRRGPFRWRMSGRP
jgi:hypothetical protein